MSIVALLVYFLTSVFVDIRIYRQLRNKCDKHKWVAGAHLCLSSVLYLLMGYVIYGVTSSGDGAFETIMWCLFAIMTFFISKAIYVVFLGLSRVPRLWRGRPLGKLEATGAVLALLLFGTAWWGALVTPRRLQVNEVELTFDRLPAAFDGYRILQVSDLHVGTYGNSTSIVQGIVDEINRQNADLVVFTGDIVNRHTDEIKPFIPVLKQIKGKDGVISILGNHDYGDYYKWATPADKARNMQALVDVETKDFGWRLLRNEHMMLRHGGDSIAVIGVENWGEPPFPTYGDLKRSYADCNDNRFKLLLSHNPKHWDMVVSKETNIDLTLSGHTHAMQMMISLGSVKLSPSSMKYEHWQGLAKSGNCHLYVNIGTGEVGIPMRIGAVPELTVFTLRCKK